MMQVFIPWVKTLPQDEVKVLIGDNLAAHLSPVVIAQCEEYNIRFIFLPENATHMLQPLDVTVFGPMKRRWREILADWKEDNPRKRPSRCLWKGSSLQRSRCLLPTSVTARRSRRRKGGGRSRRQ